MTADTTIPDDEQVTPVTTATLSLSELTAAATRAAAIAAAGLGRRARRLAHRRRRRPGRQCDRTGGDRRCGDQSRHRAADRRGRPHVRAAAAVRPRDHRGLLPRSHHRPRGPVRHAAASPTCAASCGPSGRWPSSRPPTSRSRSPWPAATRRPPWPWAASVIVKAHSGHLKLSERTAEVVTEALRSRRRPGGPVRAGQRPGGGHCAGAGSGHQGCRLHRVHPGRPGAV